MRVAPQVPERLLYATNILSKPIFSLAIIFRGHALPILLQGVKPRPAAHAPVAGRPVRSMNVTEDRPAQAM